VLSIVWIVEIATEILKEKDAGEQRDTKGTIKCLHYYQVARAPVLPEN
jgi:hypothetical protein